MYTNRTKNWGWVRSLRLNYAIMRDAASKCPSRGFARCHNNIDTLSLLSLRPSSTAHLKRPMTSWKDLMFITNSSMETSNSYLYPYLNGGLPFVDNICSCCFHLCLIFLIKDFLYFFEVIVQHLTLLIVWLQLCSQIQHTKKTVV